MRLFCEPVIELSRKLLPVENCRFNPSTVECPDKMPLIPGNKIGPHETVALLGVGGIGEVYRAKNARLGRDVAIKVLPDSHRLHSFQQEARAVA